MKNGFPLLTTKKVAFKTIVTELLWFLRGDTNIKYLVDNNCHIWDGDCYKNFEKRYHKEIFNHEIGSHNRLMSKDEFILNIKTDDEFAKTWGELGPIYGKQWRSWADYYNGSAEYTDQIQNLINDLKTNPDSRRLLVSAWNVAELDQMVLPPCHYGFQVYTRELSFEERASRSYLYSKVPAQTDMPMLSSFVADILPTDENGWSNLFDEFNIPTRAISLMWNQRSCDVPLGIPFNIASYGLLLEILAKEVNMVPDELIGSLGDCHIYLNQVEGCKEQIGREGFELPILNINTEFWKTISGECGVGPLNTNLQGFEIDDFQLENYQSHPAIKFLLSN
jgi:thymidylate synthase